jgi:hypothetical protein
MALAGKCGEAKTAAPPNTESFTNLRLEIRLRVSIEAPLLSCVGTGIVHQLEEIARILSVASAQIALINQAARRPATSQAKLFAQGINKAHFVRCHRKVVAIQPNHYLRIALVNKQRLGRGSQGFDVR